jgi:hypothetical protein
MAYLGGLTLIQLTHDLQCAQTNLNDAFNSRDRTATLVFVSAFAHAERALLSTSGRSPLGVSVSVRGPPRRASGRTNALLTHPSKSPNFIKIQRPSTSPVGTIPVVSGGIVPTSSKAIQRLVTCLSMHLPFALLFALRRKRWQRCGPWCGDLNYHIARVLARMRHIEDRPRIAAPRVGFAESRSRRRPRQWGEYSFR